MLTQAQQKNRHEAIMVIRDACKQIPPSEIGQVLAQALLAYHHKDVVEAIGDRVSHLAAMHNRGVY